VLLVILDQLVLLVSKEQPAPLALQDQQVPLELKALLAQVDLLVPLVQLAYKVLPAQQVLQLLGEVILKSNTTILVFLVAQQM